MKKKIIISILVFLIIICVIIGIVIKRNQENKQNIQNEQVQNLIVNNAYTELDKNEVLYNDNVTVNELKNETSITGNSEIYEVQKEYDGRKVLAVKASKKVKVAFAGMIKNAKPEFNELEEIFENKFPKENGIWIEENSRNSFLDLLRNNENINSEYYINEKGYLKIKNKNSQTDADNKIENSINGSKQYIIDISSVCYIIDDVTGEILDYNFENLDKYQTYEYFEDDNKMLVFISENKHNKLNKNDIIQSVINLF